MKDESVKLLREDIGKLFLAIYESRGLLKEGHNYTWLPFFNIETNLRNIETLTISTIYSPDVSVNIRFSEVCTNEPKLSLSWNNKQSTDIRSNNDSKNLSDFLTSLSILLHEKYDQLLRLYRKGIQSVSKELIDSFNSAIQYESKIIQGKFQEIDIHYNNLVSVRELRDYTLKIQRRVGKDYYAHHSVEVKFILDAEPEFRFYNKIDEINEIISKLNYEFSTRDTTIGGEDYDLMSEGQNNHLTNLINIHLIDSKTFDGFLERLDLIIRNFHKQEAGARPSIKAVEDKFYFSQRTNIVKILLYIIHCYKHNTDVDLDEIGTFAWRDLYYLGQDYYNKSSQFDRSFSNLLRFYRKNEEKIESLNFDEKKLDLFLMTNDGTQYYSFYSVLKYYYNFVISDGDGESKIGE